MAQCFICGKGSYRAQSRSHSNVKSKRIFKPNLHHLTVLAQTNDKVQVDMCGKCYKRIKNDFWAGKHTVIVPVSLLNQKKHTKEVVVQNA